ncbi:mannose-1-phosphate guanylyltransferase [Sphingobacterium allocomposti]|jgi:mannose-1-phosphate guanylyltransferase|uniref:Mannose-1-phosphate guanylyltransferase n=1 Tax=Sphingobacterium allocomposti TaxID=415956 RepID=A0A5S5DFB5_9SPHI|nr:sugar phosphate nucleotidyltransferase [Sphingobacterium composti Yoo et al. 2007 non Ten et al. 2007]TYP94657.1 mannose-1-phosphate guanylyltransferase [Sphingobacterium composti Yoo et al. 2007 non Ten et al. 2007]
MERTINVILSGGVGSRLWPLSRKSKPKQYLPIFNNKSLFALTIERNQKVCQHVMLVGSVQNIDLAKDDLAPVSHDIIVEAVPRNTAAAIAFAAFAANPDDILIVTPSDHLIEGEEQYLQAVKRGIEFAKEGYLVTFGINPTRPETGYGYIESEGNDVLSFREKPNVETAKDFLKSGNFLWNSGIFCFKASTYLHELERFDPKVYNAAKTAFDAAEDGVLDVELSRKIPSKSVDYAIMERSDSIKVVPSFFQWSDMGSFDSLYDYLVAKGHPRDEHGNMVIGETKHTVFLGVRNCVVVNTDDALLIMDKAFAQDVKHIYEQLEKENSGLV